MNCAYVVFTAMFIRCRVCYCVSVVLAHYLQNDFQWQVRQTSWYSKHLPSFSLSYESFEMVKVPRPLFERLRDIAVYAA
jgi:hypothetical protein